MFKALFLRFFPMDVFPKTRCTVNGFCIKVSKVEECILRSRPQGSADDVPYVDIGKKWHLEVVVSYNGTNPLYSNTKKKQWRRLLTNALHESTGYGMVGSIDYRKPDERFVLVEVVEKYEDHRYTEVIGGGIFLPNFVVWLRVHTICSQGQKGEFSLGLTSRPERPGQPQSIRSSGAGMCG